MEPHVCRTHLQDDRDALHRPCNVIHHAAAQIAQAIVTARLAAVVHDERHDAVGLALRIEMLERVPEALLERDVRGAVEVVERLGDFAAEGKRCEKGICRPRNEGGGATDSGEAAAARCRAACSEWMCGARWPGACSAATSRGCSAARAQKRSSERRMAEQEGRAEVVEGREEARRRVRG
jgi:hypothetical protein